MTFSNANPPKYEPQEQLELINLNCKKLSPELYENNAHYLEIIRSILPNAVRQAVYFLLTNQSNYSISSTSLDIDKPVLEKIDLLISNSLSTFTIEHLMHLADELEQESNLLLKQNQQKIMNIFSNEQENKGLLGDGVLKSIDLDFKTPIENQKILEKPFFRKESSLDENLNFDEIQIDNSLLEKSAEESKESDLTFKDIRALEALKGFFGTIGKKANATFKSKKVNNKISSSSEKVSELNNLNDANNFEFLPESPTALYKWMDSLDSALIRLLRNLSNAINLELLSAGLLNNLVPLPLLDAVVNGQINSQDSPSNLLTLTVPIHNPSLEEGIEITCLFVRPSELEFDHPKLRKCRSLLKQNRNILMKMIKQQRHWQKRALANNVSKQWLQTPLKISKANQSKG